MVRTTRKRDAFAHIRGDGLLPNDRRDAPLANLTPRQWDVGHLIAEGRGNREIAQVLGVGDKTVEKHVADLFARLGVRSRSGVAAALRARGTGAP